ncbi:MAG: chromosome segregation protein SMC, partial [Limnohabitans sp.]
LNDALSSRNKLQPGQQIFTPEGHAVGLHSVSFYAQDNEQAGLLARAQEIENLDKQIRAQSLMAEDARSQLVRAEAVATQTSQQRTQIRQDATQAQAHAHSLKVELLQTQQLAEQIKSRQSQLKEDTMELQAQLHALHERELVQQVQFESLDMQLAQTQERYESLLDTSQQADQSYQQARDQLRDIEHQLQEAYFGQRTLNAKLEELQRNRETAAQQLEQLSSELLKQQSELAALTDASAQAGLQHALALKLERENLLAAKRSLYDDLTAQLRSSNEERLRVERELEPMRQRILDAQLKEQAARIGYEQYDRFLRESEADTVAIEVSINDESIKLHGLQNEIDKLQKEIQSLGAVNLAALEELGVASERKQFLDAQSSDLNEAITTLEDAIRKIDSETRALLSDTFDTVNQHFGTMFPELFGGGTAKLVMTGGEILDSGVQVMAQPPGKINQTIYLLSGGEKALTAIALVFAIFQLNPAPFCLLDEVDAPLDDANTERYRKLVTGMSKETQFLYISHNKIAMEMA